MSNTKKDAVKEFDDYIMRYIRTTSKSKLQAAKEYITREIAYSCGMTEKDYAEYCARLEHEAKQQ